MLLGTTYWRAARFVFFALVCACALGAYAFTRAPQSIFPAIELARVEVFADAGDLDAEQIRTSVAHPLETALAALPGVRAIRSFADTGKLELELDFPPGGDVREDLRAVRAVLADASAGLPVTQLTSMIEGANMEPVLTLAVRSKSASQATLRDALEAAILPVFTGTPGLGRLAIFGGPRHAFEIDLEASKLAAAGASAPGVAAAVRAATEPHAAGSIVRGRERFDVVIPAPHDATTLGDVIVVPSSGRDGRPLRALGHVALADEPTGQQASFDASPAVLLNAYPVANGDAVALRRAIEDRLPALGGLLPADVTIDTAWDQTRPILAAQASLRDEMLAGGAIALAVILFFLRDRTLTLIAAIVVPATLALTALVLATAGLSLNVMTLGGLAIAIGLAIDEAIVVLEAIARELATQPGNDRRRAIEAALRRVARPLISATAANVVVFLPLAFLSGVPGFFFRALSITLGVALLLSTALSLAVAPLFADVLRAGTKSLPALGLEALYVRFLGYALRYKVLSLAGAAGLVVLTVVLLVRVPSDFLPAVDEGQFEIKYALPPGMSLADADAAMRDVERAVLSDPDVAHEARLSGVDTNGLVATPPDAGTIRVELRPRAATFDTLAARLRKSVRAVNPDLYVELHQLLEDQINDLSGNPEPIVLTLRGPDQATLEKLADRFAEQVDDVRGLTDTFDGIIYQARVVAALPPAGSADDAAAFSSSLRARVGGLFAGDVDTPGGRVPAVVRLGGDGPPARHARLSPPLLTSEIQEENGVRLLRVTADLEGASLSTVVERIRARTRYLVAHLPPGYSADLGGSVAAQSSAFREFALVLGAAVVLVFGVLVLTFDSFRLPLVVMTAVPLAPLGVGVALVLTRTTLNVASIMGVLLLSGFVVRNGILLVDGANRRRALGASARDCMAEAALERLRPILMTTIATLGALAPLALGFGAGSELERPLAVAVIGGLVSATAFTLLLVPLLYDAAADPAEGR
jgi:multidrug efflux pump subunit AcrB